MKIGQSGNPYGEYDSYRAKEIPSVSIETVRRQEENQKEREMILPVSGDNQPQPSGFSAGAGERAGNARLEDISLSFPKREVQDYIGKDAGLANLDVKKAISDMQRDSVLEEYQYFVGTSLELDTEDGRVVVKKRM